MAEALSVLVAARDEEALIGETVRMLRDAFRDAEVIVADDGSRDATAELAEAAGARVLRLPRLGKGHAFSAAEQAARPGPLLLVDADVRGDLTALAPNGLRIAAFAERQGGGFGVAKGVSRALIRLRTGFEARAPLSGQRALSPEARAAVFPLAPGFGVETRMTIDAVRAGLRVVEIPIDGLSHRPTGRGARGFAHRARQGRDILAAVIVRVLPRVPRRSGTG